MTSRIVTAPIRLTGSVHPQQVASFIALDALVRRSGIDGAQPVGWDLIPLVGDVAAQYATERQMAREGESRDGSGREAFVARAQKLQADAQSALRSLFDSLAIDVDMDVWASHGERAAHVARVAFVRLYEAGLLTRTDAVLNSCPSCETVVDTSDADPVDMTVQNIRLHLETEDGDELLIDVTEPELLIGAAAVAVPVGDASSGKRIYLPLLEDQVPVISIEDLESPRVVVPSHDQWAYSIARQLNYRIVGVLDDEGVVKVPGPFAGLSRFAARAAATEDLIASGMVMETFDSTETALRCHLCSTVLVPIYGQHWVLSFKALVEPVLELLEEGAIAFSPPAAAERMKDAARAAGSWCVSQQLWSGQQIPVYRCLDCGQTTVSVDQQYSCPSCMGTLEQDSDVLDARFVAAVTPLAMMGWPQSFAAENVPDTVLSVGRSGLDTWALPMVSLAYRLAGVIPFTQILVHQFAVGVPEQGKRATDELVALSQSLGVGCARLAFLLGDLDPERAGHVLSSLEDPGAGPQDATALIEPYDKAVAALDAGGALALLSAAVAEGITPESVPEVDRMTSPLIAR